MESRTLPLREVYVWEFPVRLYHWVNALCVTALCITGFLIGNPLSFMKGTEAYFNYWSGLSILSSLLPFFSILYSGSIGDSLVMNFRDGIILFRLKEVSGKKF